MAAKQRLHAHANGGAVDGLLVSMTGQGLAAFDKGVGRDEQLDRRPLLVVFMDEGSPTYALSHYVMYATQTRCLFRDAFHRLATQTFVEQPQRKLQ